MYKCLEKTVLLPPGCLSSFVILMLYVSCFGFFFLSYKSIYYSSHHARASSRSTAHYCSSCIDTSNFRRFGFYSLQLGLKRVTIRRLEFGLQSHHFRLERIDSSLRFRLAFFFEKAMIKARISILIISQYNPLSFACSYFFETPGSEQNEKLLIIQICKKVIWHYDTKEWH